MTYFPKNYLESRKRFLTFAKALKGEQGLWEVPSQKDKDLFIDHAYWPALEKPETLLVITSGIHGSEMYAGSAILQMFMHEIMLKINRQKIGIFFVHAMNPYGFKHHQRTTENGVNLNRNFSVSEKLFNTKNQISERYHGKFFSYEKVASMDSRLLSFLRKENGKAYFDDVSLDQLVKGIAPGQFERPDSLEFGGKALEPQTRLLIEKMRQLVPQYQDILAFDLHTGLGEKNRLHLLTSGSGADLHPELFAKLFDQKADKEFYVYTPPAEEGFYEVHGALNTMFVDLASKKQRVCTITMEFGTFGHDLAAQLQGLNCFFLSHQGQYYGFDHHKLEKQLKQENFIRSYPQDDKWRNAVIAASRGLFVRVLARAGVLEK
jgi:predicted deacylase